MYRLYGLKNCDTCRKAAKALGGELVDIREKPLSKRELTRFEAAFGEALLNTRSTTWRELDEDRRLEDPIELMMAFPALMKRPVITRSDEIWLGWGADVRGALLG
ncbi:MAG: arsenate reductase family protein [Paracoccaceae bacterium]